MQTSTADRVGTFLLDPKNITITDSTYNQYSILIGYNYDSINRNTQTLDDLDNFGTSVSIEGTSMVVGAPGDDGIGNQYTDTGAVYFFTFSDATFSNGLLEGIIGKGFTGGKNINISLDNSDNFGSSVSLNLNRLAIGATGDDGSGNSISNAGAVYLYSFTDEPK